MKKLLCIVLTALLLVGTLALLWPVISDIAFEAKLQTIASDWIALHAQTNFQSDNYLLTINTVGSGTGYFACNGQMVEINWSRKTVNDPFTFTLKNGDPVTFGVGATYIGVVPTNATVNWE